MKHKLPIISILLLSLSTVKGQSIIREVDYEAPVKSIVRMDNDVLLTYMETAGGTGSFGSENGPMVTMKQAKLPSGYGVTDLRIPTSSRAYFCGMHGNIGYVGHFKYPDFFMEPSLNYTFFNLPNVSLPQTNEVLDNFEPRRMAVYFDNDYHCYVVGVCRKTNTNGESSQVYFIGYLHGNQLFTFFEVLIGPTGVETYDDVAVTDNYVVVSGHKNGSVGTFLRLIEKGMNLGGGTTSSTLYQVESDNYSPVVIASLPGDAFALASYSRIQNRNLVNTATFEILPGASPTINVLSSKVTEPEHYNLPTPIQIKELVHDPVGNRLLLLQDVGSSLNHYWTVGDYPMVGNVIMGGLMKHTYSSMPALTLHSIAIKGAGKYVGTGWMNRVVWVETGVSGLGPCLPTTSVPMNDNPIEVYVSFMPIVTGVINAPTHTGSNPILQRGIHTICQ